MIHLLLKFCCHFS